MFDQAQQLVDEYEKSHPPLIVMYSKRSSSPSNHRQHAFIFVSTVLATMLSGARTARHSTLAQALYNRMRSLFPDYKSDIISASILLSNTYASLGDEEQAKEVRDHRLQNYGSKVQPDLTMTMVNGEVLVSSSDSHRCVWQSMWSAGVQSTWQIPSTISRNLCQVSGDHGETERTWIWSGCLIRHSSATRGRECRRCAVWSQWEASDRFQSDASSAAEGDRADQESANLRWLSSVSLALRFIRVMNVLFRVVDATTKLIAKVYGCHIFARDANRCHHFQPNGQCSCMDHFWAM